MQAGRELDALVAENVMGLYVVDRGWPCGHEPECGCYEADLWADPDPQLGRCSWYTDLGPVYAESGLDWPPRETDGYAHVTPVPFYSTSIINAWQVVEKLSDRYHWQIVSPFEPGRPWFAGVTPHSCSGWNGRPDIEAGAETAPLAICLCALKAAALGWDGLSDCGDDAPLRALGVEIPSEAEPGQG